MHKCFPWISKTYATTNIKFTAYLDGNLILCVNLVFPISAIITEPRQGRKMQRIALREQISKPRILVGEKLQFISAYCVDAVAHFIIYVACTFSTLSGLIN